MSHSHASRAATAALLSLLALAGVAPTAAARPDPGDSGTVTTDSLHRHCALMRIGTQLIRCDDLTGAGVTAPLFIPELEPLASSGSR